MSMSVTSASVPFHYLPHEQRSTEFLIRSRTSDLMLGSESNLQFELQQENGSGTLTSNNARGSANSLPLPSGPSGQQSDSDWRIERSSFDLSQFDEWKKNMNQKLASAAEQHRVKR